MNIVSPTVVLAVSLSLSTAALSQDAGVSDAGVSDAGPSACAITCMGDDLVFCDGATSEVIRVDCADFGGRCGELFEDWGADCILNEGAACSAGYADDRSRCDPAVPLYCNDDVCSTEPPAPEAALVAPTTAGGIGSVGTGDESPLACLNCTQQLPFDLPFLSLFVGLGARRIRRGLRKRRNRHGDQ